ncbi:hypothetical protein ACIOWI_37870, partial [Streptomyces sp. NPDC087659]|uniref:hypothetical protein n=1 Tax=Streptomyces sp. NPDC087659 TaxID=3365801 RepID=UPI0037F120C5
MLQTRDGLPPHQQNTPLIAQAFHSAGTIANHGQPPLMAGGAPNTVSHTDEAAPDGPSAQQQSTETRTNTDTNGDANEGGGGGKIADKLRDLYDHEIDLLSNSHNAQSPHTPPLDGHALGWAKTELRQHGQSYPDAKIRDAIQEVLAEGGVRNSRELGEAAAQVLIHGERVRMRAGARGTHAHAALPELTATEHLTPGSRTRLPGGTPGPAYNPYQQYPDTPGAGPSSHHQERTDTSVGWGMSWYPPPLTRNTHPTPAANQDPAGRLVEGMGGQTENIRQLALLPLPLPAGRDADILHTLAPRAQTTELRQRLATALEHDLNRAASDRLIWPHVDPHLTAHLIKAWESFPENGHIQAQLHLVMDGPRILDRWHILQILRNPGYWHPVLDATAPLLATHIGLINPIATTANTTTDMDTGPDTGPDMETRPDYWDNASSPDTDAVPLPTDGAHTNPLHSRPADSPP